jgi:hypothetical protein
MTRILGFIVALLLGIAGGLAIGWLALPAANASSAPESLRMDYKADTVLMVAETYQADRDLGRAAGQLALLGGDSPVALANQAVVWARDAGYSADDLRRMASLATALRSWTPTPAASSAGGQP